MIKTINSLTCKFVGILIFISGSLFSQTSEIDNNWDNQIYLGNKVTFGSERWKHYAELQVRLEDNMQRLDRWYLEGVSSFLVSENIEIVPDFRFSVKPDKIEFRPGLGVLYKFIAGDYQFVNQVKWQIDLSSPDGSSDNGMRYGIFINHKINEKLASSFGAGIFYRWRNDFQGFQFVRFGPSLIYVINKKHTINFSYFLSAENNSEFWEWSGIPVIQLIININKGYKYVPAKYFSY